MRDGTRNNGLYADVAFSIAVALVALLPRLFVALAWSREPVWDGHYYHFGAERIAQGLGYSEDVLIRDTPVWKPWAHYPVGYSAFLALLYVVFGSGLLVAPLAQAVLGTALVVIVHRLGLRYLSLNRARIAAGLAALHPGLIVYTAVLMNEQLTALLLLLAFLLALRWQENPWGSVLGGFSLGLAVLVRPASLLAAPLLAWSAAPNLKKMLPRAVVASGMAFLVALPWTLRICSKMDGCAFVSTNGGWNLAIGALTTTGRFTTLRAADGCPVVTGQVQQDRCWADVGKRVIAADPLAWLGKIPDKLGQTYNHESFAIEYLHEADPRIWPDERRTAGRDLLSFAHRLLLSIAALGVVALPLGRHGVSARARWTQLGIGSLIAAFAAFAFWNDQHPFYWLALAIPVLAVLPLPGRPEQGAVGRYLIGLVCLASLTHALFFGDDRYHLVLTPALCLLAAAAGRPPREERAKTEVRERAAPTRPDADSRTGLTLAIRPI